jgi:hypothetical protein
MQPWPLWPFEISSGAFASPALFLLAYLDPGTGSYAIQLLLATLFGGMFALKQSWSQLKGWYILRFGDRPGRGDAPTVRPVIGIRPSNVARSRAHGQPTAEVQ